MPPPGAERRREPATPRSDQGALCAPPSQLEPREGGSPRTRGSPTRSQSTLVGRGPRPKAQDSLVQGLPRSAQSPLRILERELCGRNVCIGGRVLPGHCPLQDFALAAKGGLQASPSVSPSWGPTGQRTPERTCPPAAEGSAEGRTPSPTCRPSPSLQG